MNDYQLKRLKDATFEYVSFSLSSVAFDYYYEEIQTSLTKEYKGRVLFDQLLSHGVKVGRFVSLYFDGERFDMNSYQIEEALPQRTRKQCLDFYASNPDSLNKGVLSKPNQFLIRKGKLL